jgi:hypothetical protein
MYCCACRLFVANVTWFVVCFLDERLLQGFQYWRATLSSSSSSSSSITTPLDVTFSAASIATMARQPRVAVAHLLLAALPSMLHIGRVVDAHSTSSSSSSSSTFVDVWSGLDTLLSSLVPTHPSDIALRQLFSQSVTQIYFHTVDSNLILHPTR